MTNLKTNLIKIIVGLVSGVIIAVTNGFVLLKLWSWFLVPIFEINPITIVQAVALIFLINFLKYDISKLQNTENDTEREYWARQINNFFTRILYAAVTLGFSYIITLLM